MGLISRMRRQKAVYWAYTGRDDYGNPTWAAPIEIDCRWEDVINEVLDIQGDKQLSNSTVYVDREIKTGSVLMLGTLSSGLDEANPKENAGAYEVIQFNKLPNLRNTETLLTAYL